MVIKLIDTISFIKRLVTLSRNQPAQDGQPSSFNRGIVYLIGGVLCINIYTFFHAIWSTLSIS